MKTEIDKYLNFLNVLYKETYPTLEAKYTATYGKKYAKVVCTNFGHSECAHSFIVLEDGNGFAKGDILKAAGWAAPAKNFKRGSVFGQFGHISIYGA